MDARSSGPGSGPIEPGEKLPLVALVSAFLVGPVGIALGAWWLSRRHPDLRKRQLAWGAIAVGVVQTVVVGSLALAGVFGGSNPSAPLPTSTAASYPTTPPPNAPLPDPSVTPTPVPPTAETLEEFVPEAVDSYGWESAGEDPDPVQAGAESAEQGTFVADGEEVQAGMSEWATPEEAEAWARSRAESEFPGEQAIGEGDLRYGAGHWWYFERDGVGTVFWYHGKFSAEFTGTPEEVQEFYLRFPK